jgi:hypothetical protein
VRSGDKGGKGRTLRDLRPGKVDNRVADEHALGAPTMRGSGLADGDEHECRR